MDFAGRESRWTVVRPYPPPLPVLRGGPPRADFPATVDSCFFNRKSVVCVSVVFADIGGKNGGVFVYWPGRRTGDDD